MNFDVPEAKTAHGAPAVRRLDDMVATSDLTAGTAVQLFALFDTCLAAAGAYREQVLRVDVRLGSQDQLAALDEAWRAWIPHESLRPTRTTVVDPDVAATAPIVGSLVAVSPQ